MLVRHAGVQRAEVAHVQFPDGDVFGRRQCRLGQVVPAIGHERGVGQVHNLAARAVERQAERIGVGDQVLLHRAGGRHQHVDLVEIELVLPLRRAGEGPHAVLVLHGEGFGWLRGRAVVEEQQAHALGRGRPHAQRRRRVLPRSRRGGRRRCRVRRARREAARRWRRAWRRRQALTCTASWLLSRAGTLLSFSSGSLSAR